MNAFLKILSILLIKSVVISVTHSNEEMLDLSCMTDEDCKSYQDKFVLSQCENSICKCSYRKSKSSVACEPKDTIVPNPSIGHLCTLHNTEFKNNTCIPKAVNLGKVCDYSEQCAQWDKNSECFKGICECKPNFVNINHNCRSLMKVENCTNNNHCGENAECLKEKCVCDKNFIASSKFSKCIPFGSFNYSCFETSQCEINMGKGAICDNVCKCNSSYTVVDKSGIFVCLRKIHVGDPCGENSDCVNDEKSKMFCEDEKCKCMEEYATDNPNICFENNIRPMSVITSAAANAFQNVSILLFALNFIISILYY